MPKLKNTASSLNINKDWIIMTRNYIRKIVFAGLVAALYIALTIASYPLAYEAVQFRISEALTILPFFFPFAIPGIVIGVFISNLIGPFGLVDAIVGGSASLIAAVFTMWIGKRWREAKLSKALACFPPVFFNAVIIGAMIAYFMLSYNETDSFITAFLFSGLWVGFGQLVVMYAIGFPLMILLPKMKIIDRLSMIYNRGET